MIENTIENQTQFMEDQALFQRPAPIPVTQPEQAPLDTQQVIVQKKKITVKSMILMTAGVIIVLSISLMMIGGIGKKSLQLTPKPSPSTTPIANTVSDFDKAMNRLDQDVQGADPTVNDLPFPPLNPDLYIVPKQN